MYHLRSKNFVLAIIMTLLVVQSSTRPQADENKAEMKKTTYNTCTTKYPITEELINDMKKSIISDDPTFKCFLMCFLDEWSLIDEDGIIDGDSLIGTAPDKIKPILKEVVPDCVKTVKQDPCEATFNFIICSLKLSPSASMLLPK